MCRYGDALSLAPPSAVVQMAVMLAEFAPSPKSGAVASAKFASYFNVRRAGTSAEITLGCPGPTTAKRPRSGHSALLMHLRVTDQRVLSKQFIEFVRGVIHRRLKDKPGKIDNLAARAHLLADRRQGFGRRDDDLPGLSGRCCAFQKGKQAS